MTRSILVRVCDILNTVRVRVCVCVRVRVRVRVCVRVRVRVRVQCRLEFKGACALPTYSCQTERSEGVHILFVLEKNVHILERNVEILKRA